jgi:Ner family transcriptional regulator
MQTIKTLGCEHYCREKKVMIYTPKLKSQHNDTMNYDYETIKTELRNKGYSMSMIADALGCTPVNVHQVCQGKNNSYRVAKAVATVLEQPVEVVFPRTAGYQEKPTFTTTRQQRIEALAQRLAS